MSEIVDVSMSFYDGMETFPAPTHVKTELQPTGRHDEEGMAVSKFAVSSHTGTHIDAPFHFVPGGKKLDELSPDRFVRSAVLLDFSQLGKKGAVTVDGLAEKEDLIEEGDIVVIRTGWADEMEGTEDYFMESPYIEPEAAEWLVDKNVSGFAIDAGNVENPDLMETDRAAEIHKILLGGGLIIIEGLVNLDALTEGRHEIFALPLKLKGRDGSPARVMMRKGE